MEIEILKGDDKKFDRKGDEEGKKLECVHGIKELAENLGEIQEVGYRLLASDQLSDKEKDQLVDIMASAKGAMRVTEKMIAEKSDVSEEMHKKINKKADNFLAGLEGKEEKTEEE